MRKEGVERKLALFLLLILTVCVYFLWSGNQSALSETITDPVESAALKMNAIKKAKNMEIVFANPKPGRCPVCSKRVDHESFMTVRGKRYEMCSDACGAELKANPRKHLPPAK